MIKDLIVKTTGTLKQCDMIFKLLLIYLVTIPIMQTPNLPFLAERIQFSELVFLPLFFLWLERLIRNKRLPQDAGLNRPFLLFIFFCLLSFFHSTNLPISIIELLGLLYLFVMLMLVVDTIDNRKKLDIVIKFWIGTSAVVLALGFLGLFIGMLSGKANLFCHYYEGNFPYLKTVYRMNSVFRHPLAIPCYLIISLGFVVGELLLTQNTKYKVFLKIMVLLIGLATASILSRDILALMLTFLLLYSYFHKKKGLKLRIVQFLSISLMIIISLWFLLFDFLFHIRSYKIESFHNQGHRELVVSIDYAHGARLAQKMAAVEMIKRHPFLGVGLAMYRPYIQRLDDENYFKKLSPIYVYFDERLSSQYINFFPPVDPHNDTLQYLAETGIFGGGAFIFFIATFLYLVFTNLKKTDDRYFKVRLFCFAASFIGILIISLGLDLFKARHVWFLMAVTLALIRIHREKAVKINQ